MAVRNHMVSIRHLAIYLLLVCLFGLCISACPQDDKPITKDNLLRALRIGGVRPKEYVQLITQHGVDFQLTPADEERIRKSAKHLGSKGVNDLIAAVKRSYRPPAISPPTVQERPDISLRLVYPSAFATVMVNESNVLLREPKIIPAIWDLDRDKWDQPLQIPVESGDWIRPHEMLGPNAFITQTQIVPLVKQNDRLFGIIQVTCPECARTRVYWVYAIQGTGGWYAEFPPGQYPDLSAVGKLLPKIRANPNGFFSDIPLTKRIAIARSMKEIAN